MTENSKKICCSTPPGKTWIPEAEFNMDGFKFFLQNQRGRGFQFEIFISTKPKVKKLAKNQKPYHIE
jgi:hypothetical protein